MFSTVALCTGKIDSREHEYCSCKDIKTAAIAGGADTAAGLALIIFGSILISGVLPGGSIAGGFMVGLGCLELVAAPPIVFCNGCIRALCCAYDSANEIWG